MTKMTINILKHHTALDTRNDGTSCMVAQAIKDQLQLTDRDFVSVGYDEITIRKNGWGVGSRRATTKVDPSVRGKISAFDRGLKVKPFSVEIDVPDESPE